MQYRYCAKSFESYRFDAAKEKLLRSCASIAPRSWRSGMQENYAGRFMDFFGEVRFFAAGRQIPIASVPLYSRPASDLSMMPEPSINSVPETATPDSAATSSEMDQARDAKLFPQDFPDESGLRPASERISSAVLGSLLSITVAVAAGIIIANNTSFKLKVPSDTHGIAMLADATALPPVAAPARPARTLEAPAAPSLPVFENESPQSESLQQRNTRTMTARKPPSKSNAARTRVASRTLESKVSRTTRQATSASQAHKGQDRPAEVAQAPTASPATSGYVRPSLPNLATQYARCSQIEGLWRRERCKWEICGDKWGKQGCPTYKHKVAPEMGLGHLYPGDTASR